MPTLFLRNNGGVCRLLANTWQFHCAKLPYVQRARMPPFYLMQSVAQMFWSVKSHQGADSECIPPLPFQYGGSRLHAIRRVGPGWRCRI